MEVHAHTHTARKKWTHYFWEFLMLFLAVFCGFLAENYREHQVEKHRAKQYIRSLYEDLKNDTATLNRLLQYDERKISGLQNMYACYDSILSNQDSTSCMGQLVLNSRSNKGFVLADRTLRQLANAGGYRLLNREDADSIMGYEKLYSAYLDFQTTVFQGSQDNVRNTLNLLANFRVLAPLQVSTTTLSGDTMQVEINEPLLFRKDDVLLNKWFNELSVYRRTIRGQVASVTPIKNKAISLLRFFQNKYHLR